MLRIESHTRDSCYRLAIEALRHGNRVWRYVERELRLCRFCHVAVEDESHALLVCTGHPALTGLRADFLHDIYMLRPEYTTQVQTMSAFDFLMNIIHCWDVTKRLARFVFDVFAVFKKEELWIRPQGRGSVMRTICSIKFVLSHQSCETAELLCGVLCMPVSIECAARRFSIRARGIQ
ncbi:hypothetical protein B0H11DRAFT_602354 [Mycena galericulata]|nr:hypothetical protein B0H11DRAFT_602354 [Mycena galericulata]